MHERMSPPKYILVWYIRMPSPDPPNNLYLQNLMDPISRSSYFMRQWLTAPAAAFSFTLPISQFFIHVILTS